MISRATLSVLVCNLWNILLTLLIISIVCDGYGSCNRMDHDSLSSFNLSIISTKSPLNWSFSVDCCSWEGVGCDKKLGRVTNLSLPSRGLVGSIPPCITNLSNLRILSLSDNKLNGEIPKDIGRLSELEELQLNTNNLNGTIPPSLSNCTKLTTLNLRFNNLEGELSAFNFSNFVRLRLFDLRFNNFKGPLPASLSSCKKLVGIGLAGNNLTGPVWPEITSLNSLSFLSLSRSHLTNLTSTLRILSHCKNLTTLLISWNFFDETLSLSGSDIIGFQNLQVLSLSSCRLTGEIPMWLSQLPKLKYLDMSSNKITGSIPHWLGNLPNLFYLELSNNLLSGTFPVQLTRLPKLASSDQSNSDHISFELPMFYWFNDSFNIVQQYNQHLQLPRGLYLVNNSISGSIPKEIGQLKFLTNLNLSHNNFCGEIPDTISNLTNLEELDLSKNRLTGEIPGSLQNLNFLSRFSVANNDLQGPIPTGRQFDTFLSSSYEGNPKLCGWILQRSCTNYNHTGTEEGKQETQEGYINWVGFSIGFAFSFILAELAALKFFNLYKPEFKLRCCCR